MDKQSRYHELLLSLGVALYGTPTDKAVDPEQAILELTGTFFDDQKFFRLLLAWLGEAGDLVHVERLLNLSEDLPAANALILCAIALKQVRNGDRRWSVVAKRLRRASKNTAKNLSVPEGYDSEYLISKRGLDPEFEKLGVRIALIEPEDRKKLPSLEGILKANPWLRFRALIGANFRADIAAIISAKMAQNPNQAAKIARCSRETAYRLWRWITLSGAEALRV